MGWPGNLFQPVAGDGVGTVAQFHERHGRYPWRRFIAWGAPGQVLWVVLYVMLGYVFSDRVQYIVEILGNLAWAMLALIAAIILGYRLVRYFRPARFARSL